MCILSVYFVCPFLFYHVATHSILDTIYYIYHIWKNCSNAEPKSLLELISRLLSLNSERLKHYEATMDLQSSLIYIFIYFSALNAKKTLRVQILSILYTDSRKDTKRSSTPATDYNGTHQTTTFNESVRVKSNEIFPNFLLLPLRGYSLWHWPEETTTDEQKKKMNRAITSIRSGFFALSVCPSICWTRQSKKGKIDIWCDSPENTTMPYSQMYVNRWILLALLLHFAFWLLAVSFSDIGQLSIVVENDGFAWSFLESNEYFWKRKSCFSKFRNNFW